MIDVLLDGLVYTITIHIFENGFYYSVFFMLGMFAGSGLLLRMCGRFSVLYWDVLS